jgi:ABC-type transporter Mla MlaB component
MVSFVARFLGLSAPGPTKAPAVVRRTVQLADGPDVLDLSIEPKEGHRARVEIAGRLTRVTASMMARWFVPLRRSALRVDVHCADLSVLDPAALPILDRIARSCAQAGASLHLYGLQEALRVLVFRHAPVLLASEETTGLNPLVPHARADGSAAAHH